jgi:hypothetical protein
MQVVQWLFQSNKACGEGGAIVFRGDNKYLAVDTD